MGRPRRVTVGVLAPAWATGVSSVVTRTTTSVTPDCSENLGIGTTAPATVNTGTLQPSTPDQWLAVMNRNIEQIGKVGCESLYRQHCQWWSQFWNRSWLFISGKEVRRCLLAGEPVDPRVMRESTAAILTKAMAGK